jgi:hypothetical protein
MRLFLGTLILSCAGFSQQRPVVPPNPSDQPILEILNDISQRAARLGPMLEQLHPNEWVAKGAPDTYIAQWNSTMEQFHAIQSDMSALAQHPDQMTEAMKALFRVQTTHQMLGSLMGGTRKYQNPALADLIESVAAEANANIDSFEHYLLETADEKEQQYTIVDREAQRCRATLSRQPAEPARTNRKPQ